MDTVAIITTRCYAERGIATASRPSVCLYVTLRYRDRIDWKSGNPIFGWQILSVDGSESCRSATGLVQRFRCGVLWTTRLE